MIELTTTEVEGIHSRQGPLDRSLGSGRAEMDEILTLQGIGVKVYVVAACV
jgi:hypothetical protein